MARTLSRARPKDTRATLKKLLRYFKGHKAALALIIALVIISSLVNVTGTYLIKPIVNDYIVPGNFEGLATVLIALACMYLTGVICTHLYSQLMVKLSLKIVYSIRRDLFSKLQSLPLSYFDANTHGELMSRFTNDMETISEGLNSCVTTLAQSVVVLTGTLTMLFVLDARLASVVVFSMALMVLFLRFSGKRSHKYFKQQQKHLGSLNGFIEENIEGQKVVKVFNHEKSDLAEFDKRNERLRRAGTEAITYSGLLVPVVVSLSYVNYTICACLGAFLTIAEVMDIGTLSAYLVFVRQTAMPINQFSHQVNFILSALSGAERIFDAMETTPETDDGEVTLVRVRKSEAGDMTVCEEHTGTWAWKRGESLVELRGDVRFNGVTFGYVSGHPVLHNVSLYAKPGQKIAFVGSTGAGKTTVASLINRFYEVDEGRITYDGIDIKDIKKDALRHSLGFVLQDTHLFSGSIMDNIRYGTPQATDEQVIAAAKLANADSFIRRLPDGYSTMISGDGDSLSQGQRQLLAIARAAVADPPVLILDEATSSVDTRTEKLIASGMDKLMENRTVFVIAHRLSTVRNAKAILVLEHGEIIERGSHEELLASRGRYYELCIGAAELA